MNNFVLQGHKWCVLYHSASVLCRQRACACGRVAQLEILLRLEDNMRASTCAIFTSRRAAQPWRAPLRRMSVSAAAADGGVSKVRVKRQIRGIVKDLENILGDLKDVAKELKEVRARALLALRMMRSCLSRPRVNMTFTLWRSSSSSSSSSSQTVWVRFKDSNLFWRSRDWQLSLIHSVFRYELEQSALMSHMEHLHPETSQSSFTENHVNVCIIWMSSCLMTSVGSKLYIFILCQKSLGY